MKLLFYLVLSFSFSMTVFAQQTHFEKGVRLFAQNKFTAAQPHFEKAIQKQPENVKILEYLGDVSGYQKHWDDALGYYKKLLTIDNQNANYHFKYGGALALKAQQANKLKALLMVSDFKAHLHTAIELDKNHIEARWALVEIYVSLPSLVGGSEAKAKKYANELLKLSPVDGYLALGYVAEYYHQPKQAEAYYKKAIKVGGSLHTYKKLSDLYEKENQPQKALQNYKTAQPKKQRNHLNYLIGKVCAQYNLELDKGLKCLQLYETNYSEKDGVPLSWAHFRMAQIYRHKKDKRNAYNFIQKALQEKPDLKLALEEKKLILKME